MPKPLLVLTGICLHLISLCNAFAQTGLQKPEAFLGYPLGSRITPHHRIVSYAEHAAGQAPAQCKLQRYGSTYEGRPLMILIVSSEENIARLEEIRTNNLKRTGLLEGQPGGNQPAIVWLSYSVHGNESSGTEAFMPTLYDLLDKSNANTQAWLKNTVVILDPCLNPDGRDRFVNFVTQTGTAIPSPTPESKEHHEPWPGGRANHYLFDLNRDWAWQTQQETRGRMKIYNQWMPHIHADLHEQGANSPYYFAPAAEPYHERITPWQREFQQVIGKNHARYFDQKGWLYFTKERFDLFYPSYGDTWPSFNGAIGMTYEQGSTRGLNVLLNDGDTLTFREAMEHHYTTSLSTVEIASKNADKLVAEFGKFFEKSRNNPESRYKSFVIKADNEKGKLHQLTTLLDLNHIRYGTASGSRSVKGFNYASGKTESVSVGSGDLVISAYQPKSVLAEVLFEPQSNLRDSSTYDITAWALPYAYGLKAFATTERISADGKAAAAAEKAPLAESQPYAYLVPWTNLSNVKYLAALLQKKVRVRYAELPFEVNGKKYDRGTLIITRAANQGLGSQFDRLIREEATRTGTELEVSATGFVSSGKDFGSESVLPIKLPKVALLSGRGTYSISFGEIWYYFEQEIQYPLTVLDTDYFTSADLSKFDVLILPNGGYAQLLNESNLAKLRSWVSAGGKLILMENAITAFTDKEGFAAKRYESEDARKAAEEKEAKEKLRNRLNVYGDRERTSLSSEVPGAIFRVSLDNTHPLAFGYPDYYFTLKNSPENYTYFQNAWNVGTLKKGSYIAGFIGSKVKTKPEETTVLGVQEIGKGQVVYMVDNPLFRAFWQNGKLLFSNAVFLVGQ